MSLAIFFFFYRKVSGADLTHVSQICPCLELSISRQPLLIFLGGGGNNSVRIRVYDEIKQGEVRTMELVKTSN